MTFSALSLTAVTASAGQFKRTVYYPAGQRPYQVIAAQLTQSGNVDLAVADYLTNQVCILLGNGDGTFKKPLRFSVAAPVAIASGDFNGDGQLDLVVVEYGGTGESGIAIFLGDGNGRFRQSAGYHSGVETTGVAVADFNGDGHDDVAVANNTGNVMVFFGTGKGTLKKPITYKLAGGTPVAVAAGDLNGDHHSDLAVAQAGEASVAVFLNDGTGRFLKPARYTWNGSALDVKIADLRHNGKQDLVVADGASGMVVLLNNGDGTFGKATIYPPTCQNCVAPEACVVADFNLDGHLDVACATSIDDSYFYYGNGDGTFGLAMHLKDTINFKGGYGIASGDFNHDGAPDLAIPIEEYGKVAILLNTQ